MLLRNFKVSKWNVEEIVKKKLGHTFERVRIF